MSELTKFDPWLKEGGPAALVIRETLEPVEGRDGVFFPATFAAEQGNAADRFPGGYNIDYFNDNSNVCLVDTVGSQANRIEPIFARADYASLVPQVTIKAGDKLINLLYAGHRAGDAIVRCSELKAELETAFKELLGGNAGTLARLAPTSIVFGVWDSRGTQAKLPRLVSATVRAFNVSPHTRHAQYNPAANYKEEGLLDGIEASDEELAQKGYKHQPVGRQPNKPDPTHGGVQLTAAGSIRRDCTLGLAALRRLTASDERETEKLRRYILGLALVALTADQDTYLRQGCNLVPTDEGKSRTFEIVYATGRREACDLTHDQAKEYAKAAADDFGVKGNREVPFDKKLAKKDIKGDADKLRGEIVSVDAGEKKFKLNVGKKNEPREIEVGTNEQTLFTKGKEKSSFDQVVLQGVKIDAELTDGVAVKVTGKK